MILDNHIHITNGNVNSEDLSEKMKAAGVEGGVLLSLRPGSVKDDGSVYTAQERLDNLLSLTGKSKSLHSFFWINPMEKDSADQVRMAVDSGVSGFKLSVAVFIRETKKQ